MKFRFTDPADVTAYGDDWYEVEFKLDWERPGMTGLVERFETTALGGTGYTLNEHYGTFRPALRRGEYRAARALAWWALLLAGKDVPWAGFEPRMDLLEYEGAAEAGDDPGNVSSPEPPAPRAKKSTKKSTKKRTGRTAANRSTST